MEAKQAALERRSPGGDSARERRVAVPLTPESPSAVRRPPGPAFLRSSWFWAGVGVVAAGATTAVLLTRRASLARHSAR